MLLPLLALAAQAHYPHDVAAWVAIAPGADPAWVATSLWRTEAWMLATTSTFQDIEVRFLFNGESRLNDAAAFTASNLVIATGGLGLWSSADGGGSWDVHPDLPADASLAAAVGSPVVLADGVGLVAGEAGIWRTGDGGGRFLEVLSEDDVALDPPIDLSVSPDFAADGRACVVGDGGATWCSADGGETWAPGAVIEGGAWKIAVGEGDVVWVAGEGLWRSEDGGDSFALAGFEGEELVFVADLGGGLVFAAMGTEGLWRSEDSGASWALYDGDLQPRQGGDGGPYDGRHFFEVRADGGGRLYLATWEGLYRSEDDGLTWWPLHAEGAGTTRGVAVARGPDGGFSVLRGSYGAGVVGLSLDESGALLGGDVLGQGDLPRYLRAVAASPDGDAVAFAGGGDLYLSVDGGRRFALQSDVRNAQRVAISASGVVLAAGTRGAEGDFASTADGGATWTHGALDALCGGSATAVAFTADGDWPGWGACGTDGRLYRSEDGETWTSLGYVGAPVFSLVGLPDGRVFAATGDGVWGGSGAPALLAYGGAQVQALAASSDGVVYAALSDGRWARSDDGEAWALLDAPTDQMPLAVAVSPDHATDGVVVFAGYGGTFWSGDGGATWTWVDGLERYEERDDRFRFDDGWGLLSVEDASGGGVVTASERGAQARLSFRGVAVELRATTSPDGGALGVTVDGGPSEVVSLAGPAVASAVVWRGTGLEDGWHDVVFTVLSGAVAIDAADGWRQSPDEADGDPTEQARCGCGGGGVALLLPALALVIPRRRRLSRRRLSRRPWGSGRRLPRSPR